MGLFSQNSTYTLQSLVDIARSLGDIAPVLPTGGSYELVAFAAANDAMTAMIAGNSKGSPFNWKFNRMNIAPFFINSWQQDYASSTVNLGWLEICYAYNTSSTVYPKPVRAVECKRDVMLTNAQTGNMAKISWMQNDTLQFGTWGQSQITGLTGLQNPGPGVVYTNPIGLTALPSNPITQVADAFGNLWIVTGYGTCGNSNPFTVNLNPVFPTLTNPTQVATTVEDGSVTWTAVNPKGEGFRLNPMPSQTGPVWQIQPVGQMRIVKFTSLAQYCEPIPDDYFTYFQNGFFTECYRRSPDPKIRAKYKDEMTLWMMSLDRAQSQGSREQDDWGFVPTSPGVMDTGWGYPSLSPALPYGPWSAY
jgi:hypothetical protein